MTTPAPLPTTPGFLLAPRVALFLGQDTFDGGNFLEMVEVHTETVSMMARTYTRGRGFLPTGEPYPDVAAVIVTGTARLLSNPEQVERTVGAVTYRGGFTGWSLAETFVLNRYRTRAT